MPTDVGGTKRRNLSLSPSQIVHFQANALTFSSRAGGHFVCNQLRDLGRLSKGNVRLFQNQLTSHGRSKSKRKEGLAVNVRLKERILDAWTEPNAMHDVICPYCERPQGLIYVQTGKRNCKFCQRKFRARRL